MNRPIRHLAVFTSILFLALLINTTYLEVFRSQSLNDMPQNRRTRDAEFERDRGAILVGNTPIAESRPSDGQFAYERSYRNGTLYAPITGYYSYDYGRSGLELSYNRELSGTSDSQLLGRIVDTLSGRAPSGGTIQTTINAKAQEAAAAGLGDRSGAVVAVDYSTGAILAMVTSPTYNPNELASTDFGTARSAWERLNADEQRPLANRTTREVYPPGSTFKLVTAAAALAEGYNADSEIESPELLTLPGTTTELPNDTNCGGETTTLARALETSCNTAFANIGIDIGDDKLRRQADKFGFNSTFGGDIESVESRFPTDPDVPQTALSAIGQFEVAATPLQMAMVAAGIANDGQLMEPYLVQEVRGEDLQVLSSHRPNQMQRAMSRTDARSLQDMMVGVVEDGTGQPARVADTVIGGKTGTAQSDPNRPPYAWFVGFSEDPKVAIAVFIEQADVQRNDISGGRLAGPIFADVVEALK